MQTTFETTDGTDPGATLSAAAPDAIPGGIPRGVELVLAAAILLAALPVLALAAIAIVLTSRGPVLFRQERVGRGGRRFVLFKLRTMRITPGGLEVTAKDDPRITRVQIIRLHLATWAGSGKITTV